MSEVTRAQRLAADQDRLEAAMDDADARSLPALVREHRAVLAELASLAAPKEGTTRDQLAERRATRQARAAGTPSS